MLSMFEGAEWRLDGDLRSRCQGLAHPHTLGLYVYQSYRVQHAELIEKREASFVDILPVYGDAFPDLYRSPSYYCQREGKADY